MCKTEVEAGEIVVCVELPIEELVAARSAVDVREWSVTGAIALGGP